MMAGDSNIIQGKYVFQQKLVYCLKKSYLSFSLVVLVTFHMCDWLCESAITPLPTEYVLTTIERFEMITCLYFETNIVKLKAKESDLKLDKTMK